jgi:hypothetical protein
MSLMDKLLSAPPRHSGGDTIPDHAAHGAEPGASYGEHLHENERAVQSQQTADEGREHLVDEIETAPHAPIISAPPQEPDTFYAETFTIQPGEVVELLPRDPFRKNAKLFNQSAAGGAKVAITARKGEADRATGQGTFPPVRGAQLVPGGQVPRELTHTANVFAVCDPAAAAAAVVDVIVERFSTRRP